MHKKYVYLITINKYYGNLNPSTRKAIYQPSSSTPHTYGPLQINKISLELIIKPPKGVIHKSSFNPHVSIAQNYNIVEYLAQAP